MHFCLSVCYFVILSRWRSYSFGSNLLGTKTWFVLNLHPHGINLLIGALLIEIETRFSGESFPNRTIEYLRFNTADQRYEIGKNSNFC